MFTQGKWAVGKIMPEWKQAALISHPKGEFIATIQLDDEDMSREEQEANTRLIAAAPELLKACTKAHDALLCLHVCSEDITFADGTRLILNEAIAKAQ